MKNTWTQRIVLGLLALVFLAYAGLQAWRFFATGYKTETVYSYTVSESARVSGILLRGEELLDDRIGGGVAVYLAADGERVSIGYPIAEIYRSDEDAQITAKLRDLEKQRDQLQKAQDPGTTTYAHTDVLNKQIFGEVGSIVDAVNSDSLGEISAEADKLLVLMNTKQIATGKVESFDGEIERLTAEMSYYEGKIRTEPKQITSPKPGYFVRKIDGFEGKVDLSRLDELDPRALRELLDTPLSEENGRVGKLMTSHNWYYATVVPADEVIRYKAGASVTLDFNVSGLPEVSAVVSRVNVDKETGEAVVLFRSDYVNELLVNLRLAQADVNFKSVTGLRVSDTAIRYQGIQRGVYLVRGDVLAFCPVTVIYEDNGFVLCLQTDPLEARAGEDLQQYDEVVTEGAQLYDNKPIKSR